MTDENMRPAVDADANTEAQPSASAAGDASIAANSTRRSKEGLLIGATILVIVVVAAIIAYNALAPQVEPGGGVGQSSSSTELQTAPDFTVVSNDGAEVQLSDFRGQPVVLNFWASTCGPCQGEMPGFQQAWQQYGDRMAFMMVDIPGFNGETPTRAQQFIESNGYGFPVYFDTDGSAAAAYGINSIPRTYFINADGRIAAAATGALSEERLAEGLNLLFEED